MKLNLSIKHIEDKSIEAYIITSYGFNSKGIEDYTTRQERVVYGIDGLVNYIRKLDA